MLGRFLGDRSDIVGPTKLGPTCQIRPCKERLASKYKYAGEAYQVKFRQPLNQKSLRNRINLS